jgi:hypothetical protein
MHSKQKQRSRILYARDYAGFQKEDLRIKKIRFTNFFKFYFLFHTKCEIKNKPYEGYIEKLKEPIELKGRVIKYKPVAKLSAKTGAKKGGMRGGAKQIVKDRKFQPRFRIVTDADLKKEFKFSMAYLTEGNDDMLYDWRKTFFEPSDDKKIRYFDIRPDISDEHIKKYLNNNEKKLRIKGVFEKLRIPNEVKIFVDIPYIFDGKSNPEYEEYLYLEYTPSSNLVSTAPANKKYSEILVHMKNRRINSISQFGEYLAMNPTTYNSNEAIKLQKNYEKFIGRELRKD